MKREDVRALLESDSDIEDKLKALMDMNGKAVNAEKAKAKELQSKLDQAEESIQKLSEASEAKSKAAMTIEERMKAMEEAYAAKERDLAIERNRLDAQRIFSAAGISEEDYEPLMATVVSADNAATNANASAIASLVSAQRTSAEQAAKQAMLNGTPKPGGDNAKPTISKEQFESMTYSERVKLLNESPDVYKELNS